MPGSQIPAVEAAAKSKSPRAAPKAAPKVAAPRRRSGASGHRGSSDDPGPKSFLSECVSLPTFAKEEGYAHQWAYDMRDLGMPVVDIPGLQRQLVHRPTANKWFADRLRSRGRKIQAA
jgi:hypothetical protein